jgi:hypothetical protein
VSGGVIRKTARATRPSNIMKTSRHSLTLESLNIPEMYSSKNIQHRKVSVKITIHLENPDNILNKYNYVCKISRNLKINVILEFSKDQHGSENNRGK